MNTYTLQRLAAGSYDIELGGEIVGSLVRNPGERAGWSAELLTDLPRAERPKPFSEVEHTFRTFDEAIAWLGRPDVRSENASSRSSVR